MATSSVGSDRQPYDAMEKYPDAVFITDDYKLYFGTDGDVSVEYDEDGQDVFALAGDTNILHHPNTATSSSTTQAATTKAVPITHAHVLKVGSDVAQALTLANGEKGQVLTITLSDASPLLTLTPTTKTGFTSVKFSDTRDTVALRYLDDTAGWTILGSYLKSLGSIA